MTKKEIVKLIARRAKLPQLQTKKIVQWTLDAIINALVSEGRIELRNFGIFEVRQRKARKARNPLTEEPVMVEAHNVVSFQPGKIMEKRIRELPLVLSKTRSPRSRKAQNNAANAPAGSLPTPPTDDARPTKQKSARKPSPTDA